MGLRKEEMRKQRIITVRVRITIVGEVADRFFKNIMIIAGVCILEANIL